MNPGSQAVAKIATAMRIMPTDPPTVAQKE